MTTHITLKNDIDTWLAKNNMSTLAATIVRMMEAEIARSIRVRAQMTTGPLSISSRTTALPTGYLAMRSVTLDVADHRVIDFMPSDIIRSMAIWDQTNTPEAYTIEGDNLVVAPVPSSAVTADIVYWKRFTALNADGDTNWLLTNHYDICLFCALEQASIANQDFEGAEYYNSKWTSRAEELRRSQAKSQFSGSPLVRWGGPRTVV